MTESKINKDFLIITKTASYSIGANATAVLTGASLPPQQYPTGYTLVNAIVAVNNDLITTSYNRTQGYVTAHNWHSATQSNTYRIDYIFRKS